MPTGLLFRFVSLHSPSLRLFTCTAADRTQYMNVTQDPLTTEQMVEGDYSVPLFLADLFEKPEGIDG